MGLSTLALLRTHRLFPLFVTQTLGALNDNMFKNAMVVLILFKASSQASVTVVLSSGVFILPYALFSSIAGQIADRFEKSRLIRLTKSFELIIMIVAASGFLTNSLPLLWTALVGLGAQAAFFSPLKYGILPDLLAEDELVSGNGLIEAGTFLGILAGTILGGTVILGDGGAITASIAGFIVAGLGIWAAFRVPEAKAAAPDLVLTWNVWRETCALIAHARHNRPVWLSILGLSWFWTVGAIVLAEFPLIAQQILGADEHVVTLLLTVFALGVGVGSLVCAQLLKGDVSARHVPFAAVGLSLFAWDFALRCSSLDGAQMHTVWAVLSVPMGWHLLADLFLLAMCGGIYSVPLYAILQDMAEPDARSRTVACNNVVNAVFMVAGTGVSAGLAGLGLSAPGILTTLAAVNLLVSIWIIRLLPQTLYRMILRWYFETFHGVEVNGMEHYNAAGQRTVVVINHLSFADGCLVGAFLPDTPVFAVNTQMTRTWWAKPFLAPIDVFAVDPANPLSIRAMVKSVKDGKKLVIFPEGRLTTTGSLMKIYEGAGMVADKAQAKLVPIRIEGMQFSLFSKMRGKSRLRWFPKVSITILPAVEVKVDAGLKGRKRRQAVGTILQNVMVQSAFAARKSDVPMFAALLDAKDRYEASMPVIEDIERTPMSYRDLVTGALVLAGKLKRIGAKGETVGVLLPNSCACVATFFALQSKGLVPAMLNYSAGADAMAAACRLARLKIVLTSRRFVERARLETAVDRMAETVRFIWLEDVKDSIRTADKIKGLAKMFFARRAPGAKVSPEAPAVILFTSGSEGTPKGVVLSHRNLMANCNQLASVLDFNPADRVFNAMPVFHSFGLTGGTILPVMFGVRSFFYPSPLHYRIVPELIYDTDSTILFGTDTFLSGWARSAHPYDFYAVRYAFAGAEKLRDETRRLFGERFGVRVLEGYGATETSPVLAMNTAMNNKSGTVGRFLPGIGWRIDPVTGIDKGGRLLVHGPNIMAGYLKADRPGEIQEPEDGWYDTGDIVEIDADGYLTIQGRLKRFAKVAGEMVSLVAVERIVNTIWPDARNAVVNLPDARKGERLVVVTDRTDADLNQLIQTMRDQGIPELYRPRRMVKVHKLPLMGTGKIDFFQTRELASRLAEETDS